MSPATLVLAAALAAWGPPGPAPEATGSAADTATNPTRSAAVLAPSNVQPAAPSPVAPVAPPPAHAPAATTPIPIIAKAPVTVSAAPAFVAAPASPPAAPGRDLHRQWWFWAIAGGCFAGVILATILATRPGPDPYTGNTPPYRIPFP